MIFTVNIVKSKRIAYKKCPNLGHFFVVIKIVEKV